MENSTVCLGTDFSLGPHQEQDIMVSLDGGWTEEDTVVSCHPGFDEPNIKVIGEVAEGGDHMYVSFKNLSDHPVTIKDNTTVVQLHRRSRGDFPLSSPHEDENEMEARQVSQGSRAVQLENRRVDIAGIVVIFVI